MALTFESRLPSRKPEGFAFADSGDSGNPAGLATHQIEIAYTILGDADLNCVVNGIDQGILAANYNHSVNGWDQADFNYDGSVNGNNFALLAANFNKGASGYSAAYSPGDWAALVAFAQ